MKGAGGAGPSGAGTSTSGTSAACMTALQSQLRELLTAPPPGVNAGPADEEDMLTWIGTIQGQPGTPYEGGLFMLDLRFPPTYPVSLKDPRGWCFAPRRRRRGGGATKPKKPGNTKRRSVLHSYPPKLTRQEPITNTHTNAPP
jgi:hypothetical protein